MRPSASLRFRGKITPLASLGRGPSPVLVLARALPAVGLRSLRSLGRLVVSSLAGLRTRISLASLGLCGCARLLASFRFSCSLRSRFRLPVAARSAYSLASSSSRLRYAPPVAADRSVGALRYALVPRACPAGAPRCALASFAHAGWGGISIAGVAGGVPPRPPRPLGASFHYGMASPSMRIARI